MIIFLDINVLLDVFLDRRPFVTHSSRVLHLVQNEADVKGYMSAASFNALYFITKRYLSKARTLDILRHLTSYIGITTVSAAVIKQALYSNFVDLEDAIQYHSALAEANIDFVVTRDLSGYKNGRIPTVSPAEFLAIYASRQSRD